MDGFCYTGAMEKKSIKNPRSWSLIVIASMMIVIGIALIVLAIINVTSFGWWSILLGLSGLTPVIAATISIIKNDPRWILIDLILPG